MKSQSKIYAEVEGSTDDNDYDIGAWNGDHLTTRKYLSILYM